MTLDNKENVLEIMKKVYRYQYKNQTRSVLRSSGKTRFIKDTDWERGVFWSCTAAAWKMTNDNEYLDGVLNYTLHTGFRTGPSARFADDHICCQAYLDVYSEVEQFEALEPTIKALDIMLESPELGRKDWWWCDSLFMAPPTFAALARQTGDDKYLDYMNIAYWDSVEHLFDSQTGLFYRDQRYIPNEDSSELREKNGEKVFWSRGVGWVLASVPRLIERFPADYAPRVKYLEMYKNLAIEVIKYQQDDGFWRTSLLDPDNFPAPESSATALFCYALSWGINNEILDHATYFPTVEASWNALQTVVHPDGMIGWVQLPAFNPRDVKFEHNIDYGAGVFMLAATEILQLAK